jgi:hydrogenase-4 membrane subunit HyfE
MTDKSRTSKFAIPLRFGLITGLLYALLLFLRYRFFSSDPVHFGLSALVTYLVILTMYLFTGIARKKELGGYGEPREIFQSIFIVILITEMVYIIFNLIYLKFIDPSFWENLKATSLSYYQSLHMTADQLEQRMKSFKDVNQQSTPMGLLKGYGFSVIIDSLFGLIIASILRKKKPASLDILEKTKS